MRLASLLLAVLLIPAWSEPAWIELPEPDAQQLDTLHRKLQIPAERAPRDVANSVKALHHRPELAPLVVGLDRASRGGLEPRLYWMIAVTVSSANGCEYCLASSSQALLATGVSKDLLETLRQEPLSAPISEAEQAALAYALQLTRDPGSTEQSGVLSLREAGFSDEAIFEIALATSWVNFMNRMARGLGYGPDAFHRF